MTSPTFTIGQRYPADPAAVAHIDLYRISDLSAEDPDLLSDYLGRDTIAFVEWPPDGAQDALAVVRPARRRRRRSSTAGATRARSRSARVRAGAGA